MKTIKFLKNKQFLWEITMIVIQQDYIKRIKQLLE